MATVINILSDIKARMPAQGFSDTQLLGWITDTAIKISHFIFGT